MRDPLLDLVSELLCVTDDRGVLLEVNDAWLIRLGWSRAELVGRSMLDLLHPDDLEATVGVAHAIVAAQGGCVAFANRYRGRDGTWHPLSWTARHVAADGRTYAAARPLPASPAAATLTFDPVTGLPDRLAFEQQLRAHLERPTGAVLLLEVPRLLSRVAEHGRAAVDASLGSIARALSRLSEGHGCAAHLEPGVFGIVLEDASTEHAEELLRRVELTAKPVPIRLAGSAASLANLPRDARAALVALFTSLEAAGDRGTLRWHQGGASPEAEVLTQALEDLDAALAEDGFDLHGQPYVDLRTGRVVGFEALLRLVRPGASGRSPGEVFALADRYGVAQRIDDWVLDRALDALEADATLRLVINVSLRTLEHPAAAAQVKARLLDRRSAAARLCFEVPTPIAATKLGGTARFADVVRAAGAQLGLDDATPGLLDERVLEVLRPDHVKIRSEVAMASPPPGRVRPVILDEARHAALAAGARLIVDRVEDHATLARAVELQFDAAQGFLLGAPRPLHGATRQPRMAPTA